jgi:prepilin-type N-terminal cleavage/methylation domain-containing protein
MKKLGNKGFTLVELMATIVLLSIIAGIASYSITTIISNSKEKNYQLLIKEIKNAVELYYQDCKFINNDCDDQITLGYLVNNGYLKGNSVDSNNRSFLVNPNTEVNISNCSIKYSYNNGNIIVESNGEISTGCPEGEKCCPTSLDYSNN